MNNFHPIAFYCKNRNLRRAIFDILIKMGYKINEVWANKELDSGSLIGNFYTDYCGYMDGLLPNGQIGLQGYKTSKEKFVFNADTQFVEMLDYLNSPIIGPAKKLTLNASHEAIVDRDVKVGCQNFSFDKILELAELVKARQQELSK